MNRRTRMITSTLIGTLTLLAVFWVNDFPDLPLFLGCCIPLVVSCGLHAWLSTHASAAEAGEGNTSLAADRMLNHVGPDLRGRLRSIIEVADTVMVSDLSWAQRKHVIRIREQAEELDHAVANALDVAAIDEGSLQLHQVNFSLRDTLRELLAPHSRQARQRGRGLAHYVQTRVPDGLTGDVTRFESIVVTLLERIIGESSAPDVELRVALEANEGDHVTLKFTFTGGDIEPAAQRFEAVVGNQPSQSSVSESVMELAFSHAVQLIEIMDGRLVVERNDAGPPRIFFTAKFARSSVQSSHRGDRTILGLIPDLPVLMVHADNRDRAALADQLIEWQTEPTFVADGPAMWDALETARRRGNPFGLLIVSDELEEKSGAELCRELRQNQLYAATPRILLVPQDNRHAAENAALGGVATLVSTPPKPSRLAQAILSTVLGKGRFQEMCKGIGAAEMYVRSLIPLPTSDPIHIDWRYVPAADLGGDALGYQWIDEDHCAFYVIDVCGHGLDASLLSVSILNVLKSMTLPDTDFRHPGQVLTQLNRKFPLEDHGDRGFTAWYGVYRRSTTELRWAGGGHPPALLFRFHEQKARLRELKSAGPMLGMLPDAEFDCETCHVDEGDRLLVYTDGVFELETPEGKFGTFEDFIEFTKPLAAHPTLLDDLWNRAKLARGEDTLDDDFTILETQFG